MAATVEQLGMVQTQLNEVAADLSQLARRFEGAGLSVPDLIETKTTEIALRMEQFRMDVQTYADTARSEVRAVVEELQQHRLVLQQQPEVVQEVTKHRSALTTLETRINDITEAVGRRVQEMKDQILQLVSLARAAQTGQVAVVAVPPGPQQRALNFAVAATHPNGGEGEGQEDY